MAKSKKKKSGFHKDIATVLKDVPIPQGVRNWRPPDKSDTDRRDDSLSSTMWQISSVFKGIASRCDCEDSQPAEQLSQIDNTENNSADTTNEYPSLRCKLITNLDCPKDSPTQGWETEKPRPTNRVVCYRDPQMEMAMLAFGEQEDESLISKKVFGKKGLIAILLSVSVLIIILILIYKYCLH